MIDEDTVMQYAQENRIPFTTYLTLTKALEVEKLIGEEVTKANKKFARVEQIKRFHLLGSLSIHIPKIARGFDHV